MRQLFPRSIRRSLGVVVQSDGLALAQAGALTQGRLHIQRWHWLGLQDAPQTDNPLLAGWPDPAWVRAARHHTGCQAQDAALAIEDQRLCRYSLQLKTGLNVREQVKAIEAELHRQLPWPLTDTVWDFHSLPTPPESVAEAHNQRPAWLLSAMQGHTVQHVEVLATQRAWVSACEQWCRAVGWWLVRLEPAWQAEARWQRLPDDLNAPTAQGLSSHLQARAGGLALGVLSP